MPLSPELSRLPGFAASFYRAGLFGEMVAGVIKGETGRSLVEDARRLMKDLERKSQVEIFGLENIPSEGGSLIVFNHPNMEVLLPALLKLFVQIFDTSGQQIKLAMTSEITMTMANYNEKTAFPGSALLMERFHHLYSKNIISVPNTTDRKDYLSGRVTAVRQMMRALTTKELVFISPEGNIERNGVLLPVEIYQEGAGKLAILATKMGIPTVPMAVWEEGKTIQVVVGEPFFMTTEEASLASTEAMYEVSKYLPKELRGPFNY